MSLLGISAVVELFVQLVNSRSDSISGDCSECISQVTWYFYRTNVKQGDVLYFLGTA